MTPITFTLTPEDMLAGNRLAIRRYVRKGVPRFSLGLLIAAIGVTLLAYVFNPQPIAVVAKLFAKILALYMAVAAAMIVYVVFVAPRQRAKKNIAQMPALSRPQTVEWNETTITFTSENGNAAIPLTDLHQWSANDTLLILYPADHIFYLIPKYYIEDMADWDRLIAAIRRAGIKQI